MTAPRHVTAVSTSGCELPKNLGVVGNIPSCLPHVYLQTLLGCAYQFVEDVDTRSVHAASHHAVLQPGLQIGDKIALLAKRGVQLSQPQQFRHKTRFCFRAASPSFAGRQSVGPVCTAEPGARNNQTWPGTGTDQRINRARRPSNRLHIERNGERV